MSLRIAILASTVADQIAAGEVVERPSSVVKELVENALDAGAASVDIGVADGGRALIRVSDDGCGMEREDALMALARHSTSKIRTADDLVGVRSFGFRGEALPAICSVSELELETAAADGAGTIVRAAGGSIVEVGEIARRRGTTVSVGRLFYNSAARLKFLRGARSEWRAITELVTTVALTRRDVRLTLTHDGKASLALPPETDLRARLAALYGTDFAARLVEVEHVAGVVHVSGLAERPADVGTATRRVHLTVNGRAVRDNGIVRAAEAAYRSTIPSGVRPSLFLEIVLPGNAVDVNVHPAKAEVRFRDRWPLERVVEDAVRRALGTMDSGATLQRNAWPLRRVEWPTSDADVEILRPLPAPVDDGLFAVPDGQNDDVVVDVPPKAADGGQPSHRSDLPSDLPAVNVPPLMQLRRTYMMFEHDEGVVLIDQHSAHERVLYEQFMRVLECGDSPAQRLLFPMTLHLGPAEAEAFEQNRGLFGRLGFEVQEFGGHTLLVNAVPMPHPRFDAERCLRETLNALTGDRAPGAAQQHERLAATVACKAAIKAGDILSPAELSALFVALSRTTLPAHDVHGRSTIVRLAWDELDRRFGRR